MLQHTAMVQVRATGSLLCYYWLTIGPENTKKWSTFDIGNTSLMLYIYSRSGSSLARIVSVSSLHADIFKYIIMH